MAPSTAETTSWGSFYDSSLEKRLPHYEDLQPIDRCAVSDLPPPKATPTEVSKFLFQLLVSTKAMSSEDQARDVASRWKLGTGQELRNYPAIMFLDIFGKEEGFVTYREVKRVMNKKKDESIGHRFGMCKYHSLSPAGIAGIETSANVSQTSCSSWCSAAKRSPYRL
jgi:hypothetical protein